MNKNSAKKNSEYCISILKKQNMLNDNQEDWDHKMSCNAMADGTQCIDNMIIFLTKIFT